MIPLFVVLPLSTAFLIAIVGRFYKNFSDAIVCFTNFILVVLTFVIFFSLSLNKVPLIVYNVGGWKIPLGIAMVVDSFSILMLFVVNIIAFVVSLYSVSYIEKYTDKWRYFVLFEVMLTGMNGVIISGDIFNIFVFLEIASISSYALVGFGVEAEELEASFKYLVLGTIASSMILLSIVLIYSYTSTLNLADIARVVLNNPANYLIKLVLLLLVIGLGIKSAVVPFHSWLPDAHPSAPAPISAMLSGVLIKTLGVYLLTRLMFNVFFADSEILRLVYWLGIISMIVGVVLALYQWDYKRLLAYHSISQVGYMFLGIGLGTPLGILGGIFHLANHSVFKSLLFLTSGALEYSTGTRELKKLSSYEKSISESMPWTTTSTLVGSLSIAGVPPFNGFWSKLIIIIACVEAKDFMGSFVSIGVSILTLASFLKVLKYGFYSFAEKGVSGTIREVPLLMKVAMVMLLILCVVMGLLVFPSVNSNFLLSKVVDILSNTRNYSSLVLGIRI